MEKEDFLKLIMFSNSWDKAIHQRSGGRIYKKNIPDAKKEALKNAKKIIHSAKKEVKTMLEGFLSNQYAKGKVSDDEHFENIKKVQNMLLDCQNKCDAEVLDEECLLSRVSTAQKLLNVMCKYWWAAGWIKEPPHCPVDGIVCEKLPKDVRNKLNVQGRFAWTYCLEDDDKNCDYKDSKYGTVIEALKKVADKTSLAQWELELWNKKVQKA